MPQAASLESEPSTSAQRQPSDDPARLLERKYATWTAAGWVLTVMGALAVAVARLVAEAADPGVVAAGAAYLCAAAPLLAGVSLLARAARTHTKNGTKKPLVAPNEPSSGHGESN
jgi:predicted phage tail protein